MLVVRPAQSKSWTTQQAVLGLSLLNSIPPTGRRHCHMLLALLRRSAQTCGTSFYAAMFCLDEHHITHDCRKSAWYSLHGAFDPSQKSSCSSSSPPPHTRTPPDRPARAPVGRWAAVTDSVRWNRSLREWAMGRGAHVHAAFGVCHAGALRSLRARCLFLKCLFTDKQRSNYFSRLRVDWQLWWKWTISFFINYSTVIRRFLHGIIHLFLFCV